MPERIVVTKHEHHVCGMQCVSFLAILIGALIAVGLGFIFNLLSLAIGLVAFPVTPEGKTAFAAGSFVVLVIFAFISMFIPGWVAGYLGRPLCYKRTLGNVYGFATWALALVIAIWMSAQAGQLISQRTYLVNRNIPAMAMTNDIAAGATGQPRLQNRNISTEDQADVLGTITFATFFVFFIGAIACTMGGGLGIRYRRRPGEEMCTDKECRIK